MRTGKLIKIIAYLILAGFVLRFITGIHLPAVIVALVILMVLLFTGSNKKNVKKDEREPMRESMP